MQIFDRFGNIFKLLINTALIAAMVGPTIAKAIKAFKAAKLAVTGAKAATTAATTTGTSTAATAGGVGAGAAAGIVAGVGLLASGLGEGAFQLTKMGQGWIDHWKKQYESKKWWDPRKGIDWAILQMMRIFNMGLGNLVYC